MPDVTNTICEERMRNLEVDCEKTIQREASAVEARVKLWLLGSLMTMGLALGGGLIYGMVEVGSSREKIARDEERVEQQVQEIKDLQGEVRALQRELDRRTP